MTALLRLDGVTVTYGPGRRRGPVTALSQVSLALERTRVYGLVGANGAGKTTLLEVAAGALKPTGGALGWHDGDIRGRAHRERVGFVPDVPAFPPGLTVHEVLMLYAGLDGIATPMRRERSRELSQLLDLDSVWNTRVDVLSRGNAVRLAVAQALLRRPPVILCDETFAPLDPVAQVALRRVLRAEAERGAAVVVSSHQVDQLARVVDVLLVFRQGRIVGRLPGGSVEIAVHGYPAAASPPTGETDSDSSPALVRRGNMLFVLGLPPSGWPMAKLEERWSLEAAVVALMNAPDEEGLAQQ